MIHPGIDLQLDVTNKAQVLFALKNKEIDFAVVSILPDDVEIEEEVLIENKLYLVSKSAEQIDAKPYIFREKGSATRKEMEKYLENKSYTDLGKLELTSNEAVKQAVIAGIGSSILPLIGIKNELLNGSILIIDKPGLPVITKWRFIWLKNRILSPVADAYLQFVREQKQTIIEKHFDWYLNY